MAENNFSRLDANQVLRQTYDDVNQRLRVGAEVTATVGDMNVDIQASAGDNIAIASQDGVNKLIVNPDGSINVDVQQVTISDANDSIQIGDGTDKLAINSDGSINVNISTTTLTTKNIFNEIMAVPSGVTSTLISFTAPANTKLLKVDMGGGNIGSYTLYIGGELQNKKYTYYQNLNETMDFKDGLPVNSGDVVLLQVLHTRPDPADFNAALLIEN